MSLTFMFKLDVDKHLKKNRKLKRPRVLIENYINIFRISIIILEY